MVLFALTCFGLLLFLWLSFGGPIPLKPKGYQFKVAFPEATQLAWRPTCGWPGQRRQGAREVARPRPPQPHASPRSSSTASPPRSRRTPTRSCAEDAAGRDLRRAHAGQQAPGGHRARRRLPRRRAGGQDGRARRDLPGARPKTRASFRTWQQDLSKAVAGAGATSTTRWATCPPSPTTATTCSPCSTASRRR